MPIRVLIVDDSAFYRRRVTEALLEDPEIEILGQARDGQEALEKLSKDVNVLLLDLHMPKMDGLAVLKEVKRRRHRCAVIIASALTASGAEVSLHALRDGADEFVLKPTEGGPEEFAAFLRELRNKIQVLGRRHLQGTKRDRLGTPVAKKSLASKLESNLIKIVVIGASTGGPAALRTILSKMPGDFALPIVVAQHMPPLFTAQLASDLSSSSRLRVVEAVDGMILERGTVVLAPGGHNLGLSRFRDVFVCRLFAPSRDPAIPHPSVGHLFASLEEDAPSVLAVILTGIGDDGADAMMELHHRGAITLAQDRNSSVVYGMPRAALEKGGVDEVAPLLEIGERIARYVSRTQSPAGRRSAGRGARS